MVLAQIFIAMVLEISNYCGNNLDFPAVASHDFSVIRYYVPFSRQSGTSPTAGHNVIF